MSLKESFPSFAFTVYLVFLVSLSSASCGSRSPIAAPIGYSEPRPLDRIPNDPRGENVIEAEFLPLVVSFEQNRGKPVTTPIYFANDLPDSVLGVCIVWTKPGDGAAVNEIKVNRRTYGRSRTESEMIIFHELGHCELGRPHTQDLTETDDGRVIPFSLMYPTIFLASDYLRFHEHYIIELFGRGSILKKLGSDPLGKDEEIKVIHKDGFDGYVYP